MNRAPYFLLMSALLGGLIQPCGAMVSDQPASPGERMEGAIAQTQPDIPKSLLLHLLNSPIPYLQGTDLIAAELPVNWPMRQLPSQTEVVASVIAGEQLSQVFLNTTQSADQIQAFYQQQLVTNGWERHEHLWFGNQKLQFLPAPNDADPSAGIVTYCDRANDRVLRVLTNPNVLSPSNLIRLEMIKVDDSPCQSQVQTFKSGSFPPTPLLPPPQTKVLPTGGSSNGSTAHLEAHLQTQLSAAALTDHYSHQLQAAGWRQMASSTTQPLRWSLWEQTAPLQRWQILTYFLPTGAGRYQANIDVTQLQGRWGLNFALLVPPKISDRNGRFSYPQAQRLMQKLLGYGTDLTLSVNQLPHQFPLSLPLQGKVLGGFATPPSQGYTTAVIEVEQGSAAVQSLYADALQAQGWQMVFSSSFSDLETGFMGASPFKLATFCRESSRQQVTFKALPTDDYKTVVQLAVIPDYEGSPCRANLATETQRPLPFQELPVPRLHPHAQSETVALQGGGGDRNAYQASIGIRTLLPLNDLAQHYSSQMQKLGWRLQHQDQQAIVHPSLWTRQVQGQTWHSILVLSKVTDAPIQYTAHLRAWRSSPQNE
jgi:hypothetical protein